MLAVSDAAPPLPLEDDELLRRVPYVDGRRRLGNVALEAAIGRGGMGAVYVGWHVKLHRRVAVKCLLLEHAGAGDRELRLFEREARIGAELTHENLVRFYDLDEEHGIHYVVLEYVDGHDAHAYVQRRGPLPERDAVHIVLYAARGLACAHRHPSVILHRDVKPANILIARSGKVKLADLGLAKAMQNLSTNARRSGFGGVGTGPFMPPEQWNFGARLTPAADVWALGVTLYYLLTRDVPARGSTAEAWLERLDREGFPDVALRRPDVSPRVARVLSRCTRIDPEERYRDAGALARALEVCLRPPKPRDPPPAPAVETAPALATTVVVAAPDRRARWTAVGLAVLALAATSVWWSHVRVRTPDGYVQEGEGRDEHGWATAIRHEDTGLVLRLVPAGTFAMGSPADEPDREARLEVQLDIRLDRAYYLATTETTRAQYALVMSGARIDDAAKDHPQRNVAWADAALFCEKIGGRLPTEAQWERAARAGTSTAFWWGAERDGSRYANVLDASAARAVQGAGTPFEFTDGHALVSPVAAFAPNPWGFHDMTGNVSEWCRDTFVAARENLPRTNPCASENPDVRVARGGSFARGREPSRVAARRYVTKNNDPSHEIGFRVSIELP